LSDQPRDRDAHAEPHADAHDEPRTAADTPPGGAGEPPAEATRAGRYTGEATPAVDAATVLLLRDRVKGEGPLEVLLLERHLDSDFAGGALVFPGGKVDDTDRHLDAARWTGRDPKGWRERLGTATDADARGLLVAAVRETFEEVGVLFATDEDEQPITAEHLRSPAFVRARQRLASRDERWDWRGWLEDQALVLDLRKLEFWSWWVTPEGQHKRFDTRFFVAMLPPGQTPAHDDVEATSLGWWTPDDALAAADRGEVTIIFPTRRNLEALARYPTAAAALEAARAGEVDTRRIQPTVVRRDGRLFVQHPFEDEPSPI
jgi:8-oxo-dGTP pyrophosphatase MutT (NUDIX family)